MIYPKITTIDDDCDFNSLLKVRLKGFPAKLHTTESPEEFLKTISADRPDLCIIDLNLGNSYGAGFQIVKAIRRKFGMEIPLFVMSKRSSREDISYALELGANEYLTKPLDEVILINKLNQYITSEEKVDFPLFAVPESNSDCTFLVDFKITKISEFGITIEGDHLMAKHTACLVKSDLLTEIFGEEKDLLLNITNSWHSPSGQAYGAFLEFDTLDEDLIASIRCWLTRKYACTKD